MSSDYPDKYKVQGLQHILCGRMEELFGELGVSFNQSHKRFSGRCPIHGGDNEQAISIYRGGDVPGKWSCYTRHCEKTFQETIIGFVRGVLSRQKYDWMNPESPQKATFQEAIDWCCNFIGQKFETLNFDTADSEKRTFTSNASTFRKAAEAPTSSITRGQVRNLLKIPAKYFVERGWSAEVLDKYDVGLCDDPKRPFYSRIVVPVYDQNYLYCVGFTGRSTYPKCEACKLWHKPGPCASPVDSCKWRNSEGFAREGCLYNFWFARKTIKSSGVVILCEGPGDLWRLVEAGFSQGVAMLGTSLTDQQEILLETSGATSVVILTNNDKAGMEAAKRLRNQLQRLYRIFEPKLETKDLGEMPPSAVKELLSPIIERAGR